MCPGAGAGAGAGAAVLGVTDGDEPADGKADCRFSGTGEHDPSENDKDGLQVQAGEEPAGGAGPTGDLPAPADRRGRSNIRARRVGWCTRAMHGNVDRRGRPNNDLSSGFLKKRTSNSIWRVSR